MDGTAVRDEDAQVAEEARLASAAANGDGGAFAELYRRYEQCVYNLADRIVGSEADAVDAVQEAFPIAMRRLSQPADHDSAFGPELLAATHDVCHDLVDRGQPAPSAEIGPRSSQEEIREASLRLPARQREALALRGLARLSYEEIAAIMDMSGDSVAQLISRARINLYDELRGTVLASVAPPTPECERALPLIAARDDGQLEASSEDAAWLDAHVADCDRCELAVEQMQEAAASYAAWAPIAPVPWLLGETMTKVAEMVGADWSEAIAEAAADTHVRPPPGGAATPPSGRLPRRRLTFMLGLVGLLLLAGVAVAALVGGSGSPTSVDPVAGAASERHNAVPKPGAKTHEGRRGKGDAAKQKKQQGAGAKTPTSSGQTVGGETQTPVFVPAQATTGGGAPSEPASGPSGSPGKTAVQPTQQTAASKPASKPKPAPTSTTASEPPTESPPPTSTAPAESSPPAEEAPEKPGRSGEAPGKPADRPPQK